MRILVLIASLTLLPCAAQAQEQKVIQPWEDLGTGFVASYAWPSVLWHASAVAITPPLAWKVDGPVQRYFQRDNPLGADFARVTLIGGYFVPVVVPLGLYLGGLGARAPKLATAGAAALQAVAVQAIVVNVLKWLTDRAGPYPDGDPRKANAGGLGLLHNTNDPHDFEFNPLTLHGALRWPSGHAASHMALMSALVAFEPEAYWIPLVGYPLVLAVSLGMIEGDYHWLSDVLAGLLMGHAIAWQIGRHFRERFERTKEDELPSAASSGAWLVVPAITQRAAGLVWLASW
ncbi:MAG TPA: phosphatase PAP2 family protein [Polyangiales bacterium]|jgi:membrane-associated phospholipid phosphatase|nr:phosphatase PAP2 family protein [Polyangiales bacterium]